MSYNAALPIRKLAGDFQKLSIISPCSFEIRAMCGKRRKVIQVSPNGLSISAIAGDRLGIFRPASGLFHEAKAFFQVSDCEEAIRENLCFNCASGCEERLCSPA